MSMNKKKLPKAIRRTTGDVHQAPFGESSEHQGGLSLATISKPVGAGLDLGGPAPHVSSPPVGSAPASVAKAPADVDVAGRLSQAHAIVERHATYSAVGGIIPLPIANVASVMAIILRMVKALSNLYGVPFERDRARAIVVGMAGGAMPTGLAAVTSSTLYYLVPASAIIGLAVSSAAAVACTRGIGRIFVEHFESGAALSSYSAIEREHANVDLGIS
jgi:uncharacterized protein (DUF697 family)